MKPKTMILMGLAIVCGLGASYMTSRLLADRTPVEEEKVTILVATKNLSIGQKLTRPEDFFKKKEVTKENEPPDAIKEFEALKDKIVKTPRNEGEHITDANLLDKNSGLRIPEGHKAIGMSVNLEGTASGFATLPQSRVNLIWTVRGPDIASSYSKVLLENVLVLAADLKLNREGELASPAQVVTFALTDKDLLKVVTARRLGEISLALRNLDDQSLAKDTEFSGRELPPGRKKEIDTVAVAPPIKIEPKVIEKPVEQPKKIEPKVTRGHYDIENGTESGISRKTVRVYWSQVEDGPIVIDRTETIDSAGPPEAQGADQKKGTRPQDF